MPKLKGRLTIGGQILTERELTQDKNQKNRFVARQWTKGYGETVGFTAGIMFRKRKKNVPLFSEKGNADAK